MKRYRHDPNVPSHLRKLVESARVDELDAERRRLVAKRLGIASAVGHPSKPSLEPPPAGSSAWGSLGGIALTAIALIGGSTIYAAVSQPSPADSPHAVVSLAVPSPPPTSVVEPPPAHVAEPTSMNVEALPDVPTERAPDLASERAPVAKPTPATEPAAKAGAGALLLEIAALDSVRRATEVGRPRDALALLDDYAAKFPTGKLREEALVLRIEALHASGDQTGAERLSRQLLRDSPGTPYAARVRSALVKATPEQQ